jgi:hypothetical protein
MQPTNFGSTSKLATMRMSVFAEIITNHGHQAATMPNLKSGIILKERNDKPFKSIDDFCI